MAVAVILSVVVPSPNKVSVYMVGIYNKLNDLLSLFGLVSMLDSYCRPKVVSIVYRSYVVIIFNYNPRL